MSFYKTLAQQRFETNVRDSLKQTLKQYPGVYMADLRFEAPDDFDPKNRVICVVRSPYSLGPDKVQFLQDRLPKTDGQPIELHVRSVLTSEVTTQGYVHQLPAEKAAAEQARESASVATEEPAKNTE